MTFNYDGYTYSPDTGLGVLLGTKYYGFRRTSTGSTAHQNILGGENARHKVYDFLRQRVMEGRQAYIVCPLIEESDKLKVRAATELKADLQEKVFPDFRLGLIHGRLRLEEKEEVMGKFRDGDIDILVTTTVIEVGIDVANATLIVIENAERFGLAQLHQLRGRVGRGTHDSYCFLLGSPTSQEGIQRLKAMTATSDGFHLAETDLNLRGPGQLLGTRQSGLAELKIANLKDDMALLLEARREASAILNRDPNLTDPAHNGLRKSLEELFGPNWQDRQA